MATVTLTLDGTAEADARAAGDRHLRMFSRDVGLVVLPLVPTTVSTSGAADAWESVDRPGRKPLLYRAGKSLENPTFAVELWAKGASVEPQKRQLRDLAASEDPIVVTMASNQWGAFRVTGLAFTDDLTTMLPGGRPSRCTADIELTEASDAAPVVGPVPHGGGKGFAT